MPKAMMISMCFAFANLRLLSVSRQLQQEHTARSSHAVLLESTSFSYPRITSLGDGHRLLEQLPTPSNSMKRKKRKQKRDIHIPWNQNPPPAQNLQLPKRLIPNEILQRHASSPLLTQPAQSTLPPVRACLTPDGRRKSPRKRMFL